MSAISNDRARLFLSCLQYSLTNTAYENIIFKPKQVTCLESVFLNRDTLAILPTGYGKSATFHLLPKLLQRRNVIEKRSCDHPIVIVISPLNSLMDDQLSVLNVSGITAAVVRANVIQRESLPFDESIYPNTSFVELQVDVEIKPLEHGEYSLVFCHPEAIISSSAGIQLM